MLTAIIAYSQDPPRVLLFQAQCQDRSFDITAWLAVQNPRLYSELLIQNLFQ